MNWACEGAQFDTGWEGLITYVWHTKTREALSLELKGNNPHYRGIPQLPVLYLIRHSRHPAITPNHTIHAGD